MFLITIINSLFIYFSLSFIEANSYILVSLTILPFIIVLDVIFINIPIIITKYYINIKHNKSLILKLDKYTNQTLTKIIIAIIFSLRSFEAKDIFTKITLIITSLLLLFVGYKTNSYTPSVLQSIIAAIIFDFIIIKIPQELNRQNSIKAIKNTLNIVLNGHMALRSLTINKEIQDSGISEDNLISCLKSIKTTNFSDAIESRLQISNSIKYLSQRNNYGNEPISKNDEIVITLREILENTEKLLNLNEINEFPELKNNILNIAHIGIYSEYIKNTVNNSNITNLNLEEEYIAKSLIDGYLIPLESICYWYKRKARRYIKNDYRNLINFDLNSTKLFYTYDTDRVYTFHLK